MSATKKVLSVRFQDKDFPVIEIDDRLDAYGDGQVVIRFIHQESVRWTLHQQPEGILLTISHPEYHSTWSDQRVTNARIMGYKNPEKHSQYLKHETLKKVSNQQGYRLGSQRVYLKAAPVDARYLKSATSIGGVTTESPMVSMILSTPDNPYSSSGMAVDTSLGTIYFGLVA